jgi:hypothetical protein
VAPGAHGRTAIPGGTKVQCAQNNRSRGVLRENRRYSHEEVCMLAHPGNQSNSD